MAPHNTIIHGDCATGMRNLPPSSVDFVLTDPPYLVNYQSRDGRKVANDRNADWLRPAFSQIYRVLKPASFCVSFYGWNRVHLFMSAWRDAGFRAVGHIVFRKRYASSARFFRAEHEVAYLLAKGDAQPPARPIPDVIEFRYTGNKLHPTQKLHCARQDDHPKAACVLMASRRYGRYLSEDDRGRPRLDAAKVKAAERFDGKFVVISNDDTLSAEDIALGYKGGWIIESCFRRIKQTGLKVRPMFHWTPRRIEAHVKLCVLALQVQRAAEIRCQLPWARIAHVLSGLKAVRFRCEGRGIVQRTKITAELSAMLKTLKVSVPKQILSVKEPPSATAAA